MTVIAAAGSPEFLRDDQALDRGVRYWTKNWWHLPCFQSRARNVCRGRSYCAFGLSRGLTQKGSVARYFEDLGISNPVTSAHKFPSRKMSALSGPEAHGQGD
jgi:hypothetical protein